MSSKKARYREKQFNYINKLRRSFARRGLPILSVDAKKRELVGLFYNPGRTWRRAPVDVDMYTFASHATGVAIPYGIYDVTRKDGYVVVGTSNNTPAFAVHAIWLWWKYRGSRLYPNASRLLTLADSGGSNGIRAQGWKVALQGLAAKIGCAITVAHYPPGASKWNPVEHRLFSAISVNWAGEPLVDYQTICGYITKTRTGSGRRCGVRLDRRYWPTQKELREMGVHYSKCPLRVRHARTLPRLNYTVLP